MSDTPYEEPENSTVDDWMGQSVARDEEVAERAVAEADDLDEAERLFEQRATGAEEQHRRRHPEVDEA